MKKREVKDMYLIPEVKQYNKIGGTLADYAFAFNYEGCEPRVIAAYEKIAANGSRTVPVTVQAGNGEGEGYTLVIEEDAVRITSDSQAGAFYGAKTLAQLVKGGEIPCGTVTDAPDFPVRGYYQDMTRGRVASFETLKKLVDVMADCKMNMLQLYVEHVFEFKEYDGIYQQYGYMTAEETKALDAYCRENFVELVPSLSCFGHLFELLQNPAYKDLCELENYEDTRIAWGERMSHHTINATDDRSFAIIKSLIDQYLPCFTSDKFNICCDETFDLGNGRNQGMDKGRLYVEFASKIIRYVQSKGKTVMMWGDVILNHSDLLSEMPEGVVYGNWYYDPNPPESHVKTFADHGVNQVLCSGTNSWSRVIEDADVADANISNMAALGKKYNALGILNTNWGDYGNACGIWGALHGLVVGAAKSWTEATPIDEAFDLAVSRAFYGYDTAVSTVRTFGRYHKKSMWAVITSIYSNEVFRNKMAHLWGCKDVDELEESYHGLRALAEKTATEPWQKTEVKNEILGAMNLAIVCAAIRYRYEGGTKALLTRKESLALYETFREEWLKQSDKSEIYVFDGIVAHLTGKFFD